MSLYEDRAPRPFTEVQGQLKLQWNRRGGSNGAEFVADLPDGRQIVVKAISWLRPGFTNRRSRGWAGFWGVRKGRSQWTLTQEGAAYPRAVDAQLHMERIAGLHR